jgi:hypothetical protein
MTVQAWESRRPAGRTRQMLTIVLALAVLVPLGVMFFDHSRHQGERRSAAAQERHGVEYLLALGQLTIAVTDAQSAAVSGEPVRWETIDQSMTDVDEVDGRFGHELQVGERWSQLRNTIERAANTDHADGRAAFAAYEEATSLLLGLHDRLRDTAGLVRDPDRDAYHVQNAAGGALPEAIVAIGQLADRVTIAADEPRSEAATNAMDVSVATAAATDPIDEFVESVQAALDTTESRSLSSSVLGKYDRFLRAKDILIGAVPPDGSVEGMDLELFAGIRTELQAAADALSTALLAALDVLVETRLSEFTRGQRITIASAVVGVLLLLGLVAISLLWDPGQPNRHHHQGELPSGSGGDGRGGASGTPELPATRRSISDTAASYRIQPGTPAAGDRLAGEVLGAERADVR